MILKIKFSLLKIVNLSSILLFTNVSSLYAHNSFNGGCNENCAQKVKVTNKNKLNDVDDQTDIESKNSCLKKSLCRG